MHSSLYIQSVKQLGNIADEARTETPKIFYNKPNSYLLKKQKKKKTADIFSSCIPVAQLTRSLPSNPVFFDSYRQLLAARTYCTTSRGNVPKSAQNTGRTKGRLFRALRRLLCCRKIKKRKERQHRMNSSTSPSLEYKVAPALFDVP